MRGKNMLLFLLLAIVISSCKKNQPATSSTPTIVGKWLVNKQKSQLVYNGVTLSTTTRTNYTSEDFVEYDADGSGYFSANIPSYSSPSISKFLYTLKGNNLVQFTGNNTGIPETITSLSASGLAIHLELLTIDPNNSNQVDTEVDDYSYTRFN